jgi:hypothetical protein
MSENLLDVFKLDGYRIGNCQVLLYDRQRPDVFPPPYLTKLYNLCKASSRRAPMGILPNLFCGMEDLSHDAITMYLAGLPVVILAVWSDENTFTEAGFAFPVNLRGKSPERMAFAAYGFFQKYWGTAESKILMLLGLAFFFQEFQLSCLHGIRYKENYLTAQFTRQFGFHETGRPPRYMMQDGKLVTGVVSSLLREEFELVAARKLIELYEAQALK